MQSLEKMLDEKKTVKEVQAHLKIFERLRTRIQIEDTILRKERIIIRELRTAEIIRLIEIFRRFLKQIRKMMKLTDIRNGSLKSLMSCVTLTDPYC